MPDDVSILEQLGFDLDTAVFFATLSALAYSLPDAIDRSIGEVLGIHRVQFLRR